MDQNQYPRAYEPNPQAGAPTYFQDDQAIHVIPLTQPAANPVVTAAPPQQLQQPQPDNWNMPPAQTAAQQIYENPAPVQPPVQADQYQYAQQPDNTAYATQQQYYPQQEYATEYPAQQPQAYQPQYPADNYQQQYPVDNYQQPPADYAAQGYQEQYQQPEYPQQGYPAQQQQYQYAENYTQAGGQVNAAYAPIPVAPLAPPPVAPIDELQIASAPAPSTIADPGPLGLAAFATTTFVLSLWNAGIVSSALAPALSLALFYGGAVQLLAGMWEFKRNNTFGALAFTSYGAFWLSFWHYVTFLLPGLKESGDAIPATGAFLLAWTIFTAYMTVVALKTNLATATVFVLLLITFVLLTIGEFSGVVFITRFAGFVGLFTAFAAWYTSFAVVANITFKRTVLPVGLK